MGISDKDSEGVQKNIYTGENAYVQWRGGEPNGGSGEVIIYSWLFWVISHTVWVISPYFQNYVAADSLGYIDHNEFPLYPAICCA